MSRRRGDCPTTHNAGTAASRAVQALVAMLIAFQGAAYAADTVTASADATTKAIWVAASGFSLRGASDVQGRIENYKTMVLMSSLDGFYKTYPNATPAQARTMVTSLRATLAGVVVPTYVIGHQTQEDIVHMLFNLAGDALPKTDLLKNVKVSLLVGKEGYDMLKREQNALLDESAKVASETAIDSGFRMSADSLVVQRTLESLYDRAVDPDKATLFDSVFGQRIGFSIRASPDTILHASPSFAQTQMVQYIYSHLLSRGEFSDALTNFRGEARRLLDTLNASVSEDILPLLRSINDTQMLTYKRLEDFLRDTVNRQKLEALAQREQQARQLQVQAAEAGVYLLSALARRSDPQLAKTLSTVGNAAIQMNQALSNFSVAATKVDTSLVGGIFTGEQLGAIVLTGNLVGTVMQFANLFQDGPSADEIILDQLREIRLQISQLQEIMIQRFDRIDAQLAGVVGSLDLILRQLGPIGVDVRVLQNELFTLQSHVSRLEVEIHEWLNNSDRITLKIAINFALGYQARTGTALRLADFLNAESVLYMYASDISKDTTRAGPDFSNSIRMSDQLNFPLSSIINYLAQAVSDFFGLPRIVPIRTRVASYNDWLFPASAYYRLLAENPAYITPGILARSQDVVATGKQLKATLDGMANPRLFLDSAQGLLAFYTHARDRLMASVAAFRNAFAEQNRCGQSPDGCLPRGVEMWDSPEPTAYRPAIQVIRACFDDGAHEDVNLAVPSGDFYWMVPPALLKADSRNPGLITLCFHAEFTSTASITGIRMIIRILYAGLNIVNLTAIAGPTGQYTVCPYGSCGGPVSPYWFFQPPSQQVGQGWVRDRYESASNSHFTFKGQFEPHFRLQPCPSCPPLIQYSVTVAPWVQNLNGTLEALRANFYKRVADQFTQTGSPIGQEAVNLNVAKTILLDYIELGLPQTLQNNDYLRAALYGNQQLYAGFDLLNGGDVRSLYVAAGSSTPELDIVPATDQPVRVVGTVLRQVFDKLFSGEFVEGDVQLDRMIRKLDDFATVAASVSTAPDPEPEPVPGPAPQPTPPATGCTTVQPGPDWTCSNGGWYPPGMIVPGGPPPAGPTPVPSPTPTGCATVRPGPDWICSNGGWYPPGMIVPGGPPPAGPTPVPSPTPTGCATVRPGPDWTCSNGGWYPPGMIVPGVPPPAAPTPLPAPTPTGCTTVRPGPDWTCSNGGWYPPGMVIPGGPR